MPVDRTLLTERRDTLQRQLRSYYKTLGHLEEQQAGYGIRVPVDLLNELDATREQIERIETELREIGQQLAQPVEPDPGPAASLPPAPLDGPAPGAAAAGLIPPADLAPLQEALARHSLVLFVGADLPQPVTGLPARADLAAELARRNGLPESLSLAEVAQRVSQAGNRWAFTDFLRTRLDTAALSPQPFHHQVAALVKTYQLETLVTTTYDALLERAVEAAGLALNRVIRGSDLRFVNPDRPTLIKLYGDLQQPDTLVVTDRDHSDLLRNRDKEELVDEVKRAFRRSTVLFLGYNLADADFRFLFDGVAGDRLARPAYAAWPGLPPADQQMWRDRGIFILEAEPLAVLAGLAG